MERKEDCLITKVKRNNELKFKSNFFYPLVDQAIMSIKERFNLLREVSSAFSFLYTRDKLLLVQQENALLTCCKEFQKSLVTLILMK